MQLIGFLYKLAERDKSRNMEGLMLEQLCLYGCSYNEDSMQHLKCSFPSIDTHKKNPATLQGSTLIGQSWRSQTD